MNKLDNIFKRAISKTKPKNRSQFGASIPTLLGLKVLPLRDDPIESDIPDIMIYLVDYLAEESYLNQEGIFRVAGSVKTVKDIIVDIDQKGPQIITGLGPAPLNCVCSILKQWIRDIPEGLVGEEAYSRLYAVKDDPAQLIKVFQSIQAPYRSLLIYICRFLLKIISFESQNKMSKANISIIFGPNIFKAPESLGNSDELSITVVEDNFRYIRWLELLLNNYHEIFDTQNGVPSSIHDDQEISMYEFLRGNMQDLILNETSTSRSSYSDSKRTKRRSMSVGERRPRSRLPSMSKQEAMGSDPQKSLNSKQPRPISLDPDEIASLNFKYLAKNTTEEHFQSEGQITSDSHCLEGENTSENTGSRSRRRARKDSLPTSEHDQESMLSNSMKKDILGMFTGVSDDLSPGTINTRSQEEINNSLTELDDISEDMIYQQILIHPSKLNEISAPNDQLRREYEELYNIENRDPQIITKMCQILEKLRLGNTLEDKSIPTRTMSESDLSDDSDSKKFRDNDSIDVIIPKYEDSNPFSNSIARILKIRESEGRPLTFSSMSESEMGREKHVIKKELDRLKKYSKSQKNLSDEEKLIFKRLVCWYKELKTLSNKSEEKKSAKSEMETSLKYEKQIIKIRLHQFVIDFKKRKGRSPTSSKDWEVMAKDYKRYKELRSLLKDDKTM